MGPEGEMVVMSAHPDLVAAARRGDLDAFGVLVDRFQGMALRYARSLLADPSLAEDACQDAFIDAFLHLHQLRDDAAFPGWFRRVVLKHADRQRRARLLHQELGELPGAIDPLGALITDELRSDVRRRVAQLPRALREAVAGFYGEDLSVAEIAGFLGVTEGAVRKRLFDARARLRRTFDEDKPAPAPPRDAVELLLAARIGDSRRVAAVLARRPDLVNVCEHPDPEQARDYGSIRPGLSALGRAVFMGHLDVARVLLDAGASQHARTGLAPLDLAVLQDDLEMARLLLDHGAARGPFPTGSLTPLHRAAMRGREAMARLLIAAGIPRRSPASGGTPADWARRNGHAVLAALIEEESR